VHKTPVVTAENSRICPEVVTPADSRDRRVAAEVTDELVGVGKAGFGGNQQNNPKGNN
jgi:hypothetical protein